jgi:hypothetical protein
MRQIGRGVEQGAVEIDDDGLDGEGEIFHVCFIREGREETRS